ncbi:MAG: ABC transporter permease [Acidobacteria bacterium]|nr:ABC transporter permease [Acidobacteriota bacterium]
MRIPGRLFLGNLVQRRALIWQLVRRDWEQRYIGSAAGWLWGLIHPLVLLLSWTFVFQICMRNPPPPGAVTQNYTLYLLAGYLPWFLFQETVVRSSNSMVEHANLITKTLFPSEVIPISIFFSSLINHLLTLSLVVATSLLWEDHFSVVMLTLPFYMFCVGLLAVGLGWIAAGLQVYLRDTAQIVSVALTLWFWLTPIFVFEEQYPPEVRFLLQWNPLALFVRAYRDRLLSSRLPTFDEISGILAFSIGTFIIGGLCFRQLKRGFADVL